MAVIADLGSSEELLGAELRHIDSVFGRLVWLSGLRELHTGRYFHPDPSAQSHTAAIDGWLRSAHERCFAEWLNLTSAEQSADLSMYLSELPWPEREVAATWRTLETFRQFTPQRASSAERRVFVCNMRAILENLTLAPPTVGSSPHVDAPLEHSADVSSLLALSRREREVLCLIGKGKTTKEIASVLSLSCHTVANHRKKICFKLRAHSTAELIALGAE